MNQDVGPSAGRKKYSLLEMFLSPGSLSGFRENLWGKQKRPAYVLGSLPSLSLSVLLMVLILLVLGLPFPVSAQDSDGDGMPDSYEIAYGCLQPDTVDAEVDYDGDNLTSIEEYNYSPLLDPCNPDTDGDSMSDGWEVFYFCVDPLMVDDTGDPDEDFYTNLDEYLNQMDPCTAESSPWGRIALVVSSALRSQIQASLNQYVIDLEHAGFTTTILPYTNQTPEQLRAALADLYAGPEGLVGAVLIGNIPAAVYEIDNPNLAGYEAFPCDLFYMDLDGFWGDSVTNGQVRPGNGKYDSHTGNRSLEIWVSRLKANNLPLLGPEISNINYYFNKNHRYRIGALAPPLKVLLVVDDPFTFFYDDAFAQAAESIYGTGTVDVILDSNFTTPTFFRENLMARAYELVVVAAHGSRTAQHFYRCATFEACWIHQSGYEGQITSWDFAGRDPAWMFFFPLSCNTCDFSWSNNLCGTVIFNNNNSGLFVLGSTKVGAAAGDEAKFLELIDQNFAIGYAFLRSFNNLLLDPAGAELAEDYFYGAVLIGDGALQFKMQLLDYDHDGLPNNYEQAHSGLNPEQPDGDGDLDQDGLTNLEEYALQTNPQSWDTDGDFLPDGFEAANMGSHEPGKNLDPKNPLDGPQTFDSDSNPNFHEYWNGSDLWSWDPVPAAGYPETIGCYYWGKGDNNPYVGPADVTQLRQALAGKADYSLVLPGNGDGQDMDRDGYLASGDLPHLRSMLAEMNLSGGLPSTPAELLLVEAPSGQVAVGNTTHVTVSVHSQSGHLPYASGFAVMFWVESGSATLLGGEGSLAGGPPGNRYDISMGARFHAQANIVVRINGPGPVILRAKIPACGEKPGFGRWMAEVPLATPVVLNDR